MTVALAARRLVDFKGPNNWEYSATNLGHVSPLKSSPVEGVAGLQRTVLPLVELRADFSVATSVLADIDRGAKNVDLGDLDDAAHRAAIAENVAVFNGWKNAFTGIAESSPRRETSLGGSAQGYPGQVAAAVEMLLNSGIGGPYGVALGPEQYRVVSETSENGGYLLTEHIQKLTGGPIVWAPGFRGALVISLRGGDYVLESGQDFSIGYDSHDHDAVRLYLEESFSFHVVTPEACVALPA